MNEQQQTWFDLCREMFFRGSAPHADELGCPLPVEQIARLRALIVLDWTQDAIAEQLHLKPTIGDLLRSIAGGAK